MELLNKPYKEFNMKWFSTLILMVFAIAFSAQSHAGVQFFNSSDANLGVVSKAKCSTGISCSISSGKLVLTSSPSISGSPLTITGDEATDAIINIKADESDDSGDDWAIRAVASGNALVFQNDTSGSLATKMSLSTAGELSGYRSPLVAATATTITSAQCGSTFYNSGAVQMELPEASTVLGCTLTFVTLNASNFDVNPDNADQILTQTNAAGDAMRNATAGNSITIRALSASQWAVIAVNGTWSDIN